jgi:hypothetical protein
MVICVSHSGTASAHEALRAAAAAAGPEGGHGAALAQLAPQEARAGRAALLRHPAASGTRCHPTCCYTAEGHWKEKSPNGRIAFQLLTSQLKICEFHTKPAGENLL